MSLIIKCVIYCCVFIQVFAEFPADITRCEMHDEKCLMTSSQYVIDKYLRSGLNNLNLRQLDPLHVKSIILAKNPNSPVSVELHFNEIDIMGLAQANIKSIKLDPNDSNQCLLIDFTTPVFQLKGPYTVDGNVLILPISGKGDSEITTEETHIKLKSSCNLVEKDGHSYIHLENVKLTLHPKHVTFKLDGLFNGNKELGDTMNVFINENWKEIFEELAPNFSKGIALIAKQAFNYVFSTYPIDVFFK